ncbi:MAG: YfiR family protein [Verrucomicrobia bacterium]|nr:YfiR family protein [Verrucomicrobiota bacterium]
MPEALDNRSVKYPSAVLIAVLLAYFTSVPALRGAEFRFEKDIDHARAAQIKAAYLTHLIEFTDWPEGVFADDKTPLIIIVAGSDFYGVGGILERADKELGLAVQGRPLEVRRKRIEALTVEDLQNVQVLFVTEDSSQQSERILSEVRSLPILTIGESEGFSDLIGMVGFMIDKRPDDAEGAYVRMRINNRSVKNAGLRLSFKLLGMRNLVQLVEDDTAP